MASRSVIHNRKVLVKQQNETRLYSFIHFQIFSKMFYFEIIHIFCMRQQNQSKLCNWQSLSAAILSFHQGSLKSQLEASVLINPPVQCRANCVPVSPVIFQFKHKISQILYFLHHLNSNLTRIALSISYRAPTDICFQSNPMSM